MFYFPFFLLLELRPFTIDFQFAPMFRELVSAKTLREFACFFGTSRMPPAPAQKLCVAHVGIVAVFFLDESSGGAGNYFMVYAIMT
jgi:hypothetical protein